MKVRKFQAANDYEKVCELWSGNNFPSIPLPALPENGLVVSSADGEEILAAGWVYKTDSAIAWPEWIVGNQRVEKQLRRKALDLVIKNSEALAKKLGFTLLFSSLQHPALITRFKNHGFSESEVGMTNMIKRIS